MNTKIASVRIDNTLLERVDFMAKLLERSRAWIINHAIQQYLEHEEWFIKAVEQGIEQAQTGQMVSHDAVKKQWENKFANQMDNSGDK